MDNFLLILVGVAILVGVVEIVSPEGDLKKYVRFAGSLCILLAIVVPVYSFFADGIPKLDGLMEEGSQESDYNEIFMSAIADGSRATAENVIREGISSRFSLDADRLSVSISICRDGERYFADRATVGLYSSFINVDPVEISDYVSEILGCECEVIYQ